MKRILGEIHAIVTEIRGIKKEIKSLDSFLQSPIDDSHKRRICHLLDLRIGLLLDRLQEIAEGNARV